MKKGQKLQYIGKGFLGFNPEQTTMYFSANVISSINDIWVSYNGLGMIVRKSEVKEI